MKKIQFTENERNWLKPLLEKRLEVLVGDISREAVRHTNNVLSALNKISVGDVATFREWEKIMCESCTNEQLDRVNQATKRIDAYSLLNYSSLELNQWQQIDIANDILEKLTSSRYKKLWVKERTSYSEYVGRINKLKAADIIFVSGSTGNSPYKVGFVYNKTELCVFELRSKIDLNSICFFNIQSDVISYGKRFFQMVLNRQQAFDKFNLVTAEEYTEGQLPFLLQLLN